MLISLRFYGEKCYGLLQDLYETDSYIEFTAQNRGYIAVRGQITRSRNRHTQQLTFENEIEQTYFQGFVSALTADYAKYAEEYEN